jgi:hypothetical protein
MTAIEHQLYAKLAQVAGEVSGVGKDGRNDFHKYDYTTAEAMLRAIRGPLIERGVVLMPSVTAVTEREISTNNGKASTVTTVHVDFTFVDAESGAMHKCSWAGQGDDPADKGLGKAYTNAIKTFLREAFLLPMGDDPEADKSTDERASQRTASNGTSGPRITEDRACALEAGLKILKDSGTWTGAKLKSQLVAAGARDTSSVGKAIRSLSSAQADALEQAMSEAAGVTA